MVVKDAVNAQRTNVRHASWLAAGGVRLTAGERIANAGIGWNQTGRMLELRGVTFPNYRRKCYILCNAKIDHP